MPRAGVPPQLQVDDQVTTRPVPARSTRSAGRRAGCRSAGRDEQHPVVRDVLAVFAAEKQQERHVVSGMAARPVELVQTRGEPARIPAGLGEHRNGGT